MRPEVVTQALKAAKLHPRLVAAMIAETLGVRCWPEFEGITPEKPVMFNKRTKQGGVESAYQ